jgi:transposase-like protein
MTGDQESVLEAVRAGATIEEAARGSGRPVNTVRRWLQEGRKGGPNEEFALAVDAARESQKVDFGDDPMTLDEVEQVLAKAIRSQSIPAVRIWLQLHPPEDGLSEDDDPFAEFV